MNERNRFGRSRCHPSENHCAYNYVFGDLLINPISLIFVFIGLLTSLDTADFIDILLFKFYLFSCNFLFCQHNLSLV